MNDPEGKIAEKPRADFGLVTQSKMLDRDRVCNLAYAGIKNLMPDAQALGVALIERVRRE